MVAIIGILAAIAIPNLLTAMHRSRQKRTMADLRNIATAWEARATDTNTYDLAGLTWPAYNTDITADGGLQEKLQPTYMKKVPSLDAWNKEFKYGVATSGESYSLASAGKDKTFQSVTSGPLATTDFDCDIVFSDGNFVAYPEGVQQQ